MKLDDVPTKPLNSANEFKTAVFEAVRNINHLNLVKDWKKYIIHSEFRQCNGNNDSEIWYSAEICFVNETYTDEKYYIKYYSFFYSSNLYISNSIMYEYFNIYRDAIKVISKLENKVNSHPDVFFNSLLKKP